MTTIITVRTVQIDSDSPVSVESIEASITSVRARFDTIRMILNRVANSQSARISFVDPITGKNSVVWSADVDNCERVKLSA